MQFLGDLKISVYLPYISYVYEPCMFILLLAKAVSCPVSVVKANHSVQGGGATNHVRREIKHSVATNGALLPFCRAVRLKK